MLFKAGGHMTNVYIETILSHGYKVTIYLLRGEYEVVAARSDYSVLTGIGTSQAEAVEQVYTKLLQEVIDSIGDAYEA
jgi:hypothetical protein